MAKLVEVVVSHSVGVKANLGNYESGDAHLSTTERWDVSDLDEVGIASLVEARRIDLKSTLDALISEEYRELRS